MAKKQITYIRNSEVQDYKKCRMLWHWAYRKTRKPLATAPQLACGTLWHKVMELWYLPGTDRGAKHPRDLIKKANNLCVKAGEYEDGLLHAPVTGSKNEEVPIVDLVEEMANVYFHEYEYDEHLEVIVPETTFQVDVHDKSGKYVGTAVGQIDLTVYDHELNQFGFYEHKTGASLDPFGAPEHLDDQSGMYWTYGPIYLEHVGLIESADDITFLRFNRVMKFIDSDDRPEDKHGRKLNKDGTVSKRQPPERVRRSVVYRTVDQRRVLDTRFQKIAKEMQLAREGKLPIYKHPDRHCLWCSFKDACDVHEMGEDYGHVIELTTRKWDPYEDHRKKETAKA